MVLIYIYIVTGAYKLTYNWGASHCINPMNFPFSWLSLTTFLWFRLARPSPCQAHEDLRQVRDESLAILGKFWLEKSWEKMV